MILIFSFLIYHAQSDDCTKGKPFCESCNSNGECERCRMSQLQGSFYLENGNCVSCKPFCFNCTNSEVCIDCFNGYGKDTNGNCVPCEVENCRVCNASTFCIDCLKETGLSVDRDPESATYGQCVKPKTPNCLFAESFNSSRCYQCEDGYDIKYSADGYTILGCVSCESYGFQNCKKCISHYYCEECKSGYSLNSDGDCIMTSIANCIEIDHQNQCVSCKDGFCLTEEGTCETNTIEHCLRCKNGKCLVCDDNDYQVDIKTGLCVDCHIHNHCKKCNKNYYYLYCDQCMQGYELYFDKCVPQEVALNCSTISGWTGECIECHDGFHLVEETGACVECEIENCASCQKGTDTCDRCFGDLLVDMDGPSATYGKCVECRIENCALCLGSPSVCAKCKEGFEYINTSYCKYLPTASPTASASPVPTPTEIPDEFTPITQMTMTDEEEETTKNEEEETSKNEEKEKKRKRGAGLSTGGVIGTAFGSAVVGGLITGTSMYAYFKSSKPKKVANFGKNDNLSSNVDLENIKEGNKGKKSRLRRTFNEDEEEEEEELKEVTFAHSA